MIQALRNRHRAVMVFLALCLPTLFVLGLLSRSPSPPSSEIPIYLEGPSPNGAVVFKQNQQQTTITVFGGTPAVLCMDRSEATSIPDPLLYWSAHPVMTAVPPQDAHLLGPLSGSGQHFYCLPARAFEEQGFLLLFSPAHRRISERFVLNLSGQVAP